jgi:hypothetical protein
MKISAATAILALTALMAPQLEAGVIPVVWSKAELIPKGYANVVKLQCGEKVRGSFGRVGSDEIMIHDETDTERTIPKSHVVKITSTHKTENDSLAQGPSLELRSEPLPPFPWHFIRPRKVGPELFYQAPKE